MPDASCFDSTLGYNALRSTTGLCLCLLTSGVARTPAFPVCACCPHCPGPSASPPLHWVQDTLARLGSPDRRAGEGSGLFCGPWGCRPGETARPTTCWAVASVHYLAQGPGREGRGGVTQGVVEGVKV